ncbi:MAG TPA: O-antigen ligase family protein [Candidatus Polarisedimenticolia bacterium]|jgi:O-antigen ligase|nr:O-antigen ligase family protein [Candidatus Polarisedimenticolia bacterium]
MSIQRILTYGLCAVLILAPLPFGSVQPGPTALLVAACCLLGILWIVWRTRRGLAPVPWKDPVLAAGALIALLGVLQTIPLPRPVLKAISPRAVEFRQRYEPASASSEGDSSRRPVSLYPWATRQAILKLAAFWLVLLVTIDLAAVGPAHRTLAAVLVASGGFQAIYGLAEYFSDHQHIFGYAKKYYTNVATGTFINRNHFAGYLELTIPLAIALAATAFARLKTNGLGLGQRLATLPGQQLFKIGTLLVLALTMATALVCSGSRMGIASTLLALLSVGLVLAWRGRGKGFIVAAFAVAGATLLLFSQGDAGGSIVGRFVGIGADLSHGVGRWGIWTQALSMVQAFPIAGVGLGVFPDVFPAFRRSGEGIYLDHAHNDFLEYAAETGAVGCVVLAVAVLLVMLAVLRRPAGLRDFGLFGYAAIGSVLAIALHSITDFNLAIPGNALTVSVLLGMVICWTRPPSLVLALDREPPRPWLAKSLLPAAVISGLACLALSPLRPDVTLQDTSREDESPGALASFTDPHSERPGGAEAVTSGGNAERMFRAASNLGAGATQDLQVLIRAKSEGQKTSEVAARYIEARLRNAIDLQRLGLRQLPTSSGGHVALGHLQLSRCAAEALLSQAEVDCVQQAMPEFLRGLELNPVGATTHAGVASILLAAWPAMNQAQRANARPVIERAVTMNRGNRELRQQAASIETIQRPVP